MRSNPFSFFWKILLCAALLLLYSILPLSIRHHPDDLWILFASGIFAFMSLKSFQIARKIKRGTMNRDEAIDSIIASIVGR